MRRDAPTLDDAEIEQLAREGELAAGYREAARRALAFAHRYRDEEGTPGGARERACIVQAQAWRKAVRDLHAGHAAAPLPDSARPGLARARATDAAADNDRKTG